MKNLFFLLILFFLHLTDGELNAQGGWYQQMSGTEQPLYGIYFSDAYTGTAVGVEETILRTTDGGRTWVMKNNGVTNTHLFDVKFIDSNTGIVVGITGTIFRTTNGGENWTSQTNGIIPALFSVAFADENNVTVVGHTGIIMRSTDGGINWEQKPDAPTTLRSVHFVNANNGFAVGDNGLVMRTTDGGANWLEQPSGIQVNLQDVYFTDNNTGTVVGGSNLTGARIYRTTDAGSTWILQQTIPNIALMGVHFTDSQTGTAVGWDGIILSTSDGGTTWVNQNSPTTSSLISVFFVNSDIGFAVGGVGTILAKVDSGVTNVTRETIPEDFILEQNYPNPFNPATKIKFAVAETQKAELKVFDLLGNEVVTLFNEIAEGGKVYEVEFNSHSGDGQSFRLARNLSSGIYFYQLKTENKVENRKMLLIK